jgi:hypothetical protein
MSSFQLPSALVPALVPAVVAHLVGLLSLVVTSPGSRPRFGVLGLIVALASQSIALAIRASGWGEQFCFYMFGYAIHANYFLFVCPLDIPQSLPIASRLSQALRCLFSPRLDIPQKALPPFSSSDLTFVPSRRRFLIRKVWTILWTVLVYHYLLRRYRLCIFLDDYAPPFQPLLRRLQEVDAREAIIRIYVPFTMLFASYLLIQLGHAIAAIIGVGILHDEPASWPPLHGSPKETYTLRRYFSHFWHKAMRKAFTGNAAFIAHRVLRIHLESSMSRYAVTVRALLVSGVMHSVAASSSWRCASPRQLWYYCSLLLGICFEDFMQWAYCHYVSRKPPPRPRSANG